MVQIRAERICKRFGATLALSDVDLTVRPGEVHALIGENGAGKSTLGKIIAGVHAPTSGTLFIDDEPIRLESPRAALRHGVTAIAQELSLVPARSTTDNVFLGFEHRRGISVDTRRQHAELQLLMERTRISVPSAAQVGRLPIAEQQKIEILRALNRKARLIFFDEPTARLSKSETDNLLQVMRDLAGAGTSIVFVSHFLDQVLDVADTVTVLRDGRVVRTSAVADESSDSLLEAMIGRQLSANFPPQQLPPTAAPVRLEIRGLSRGEAFKEVTFHARAGEIVGVAGLVGSGRTELARAILGAEPPDQGTTVLDGAPLDAASPGVAIRAGVAFIPESRKDDGLLLGRSVCENISLPHLSRFSRASVLRRKVEQASARQRAAAVGLRGAGIDTPTGSLSGGNQQKLLFARWLSERPKVLIADEPTRGVDMGAKRAIYDIVVEMAAKGTAVIMISSELDEIIGLAHRVLVMRAGRLVAELTGAQINEATIVAACFGNSDAQVDHSHTERIEGPS